MPTYEYACQKCSYEFEKFQSMKDEPVKKCPKCKGRVIKKISTGAGLIFKGSGFYITDYRSDNYKKGASSESGAGTAKTEVKAETKTSGTAAKASTT